MAGKLYVGRIGARFTINMQEDISDATIHTIKVRKPSADVVWAATVYNSNYLHYTVVAGDLDEAGTYYLQPYLEAPGWEGLCDTVTIEVYDPFK